ncbi:PLP-dependent aminotransferase family protein [Amphritea sp. HPY]|uniref:aminotransferase-like domain-containing protein n=1 Tax=Amphritea sp. HPY TaxID=3421652 RepID=UPI003D7CDD12
MQPAQHTKQIQPSYIREILKAASAEGVMSLAGGLPATEQMPMQLISDALRQLTDQRELFQYGESRGLKPLTDYLREQLQLPAEHQLLITNGSQQGLDLIARSFINPGDGVALEVPAYLGASQVFQLAGAQLFPLRQTRDGPDLEQLETLFANGKIKLFYSVPDFHNPTGVVWSAQTRQEVARLCRHYGIALIEDAPYRQLRFTGEQQITMSSLYPEATLSLHSYSKIAFPGMRLAAVSGPDSWLETLLKIKQASDLHTALPLQQLLYTLLSHTKFSCHIESLQRLYRQRYQALAYAIKQWLSPEFSFTEVEGGMFLWLEIPGVDSLQVARQALQAGVAVVPGEPFYPDALRCQAGTIAPALRLNFSNSSAEDLSLAVQRLQPLLSH